MSVHAIVFTVGRLSGTADQLNMDSVLPLITTSGGSLVRVTPFNEKDTGVAGHTKQEGVSVMLTSIGVKSVDAKVWVRPQS